MKDVDAQISILYKHDQGQVWEEDKSSFLLPFEVQIKRHNIYQKHWRVESVDLAHNAWQRTRVAGMTDGAWLRRALQWKRHKGRRPRVRKTHT